MSLKALGDIAAQERNYPAACSLYRQSLAIPLELGESADTAESVEKLAAIGLADRQFERAALLWAAAGASGQSILSTFA